MNFLGIGDIIKSVGDAADDLLTSDEEIMKLELEGKMIDASLAKAFLEDTARARDNQSKVQESAHASWLSKNVHSILAVGIIGLTFSMYFLIVFGGMKELFAGGMKEIVIYILGALTTVSTQVAAYFFGSSQGSKEKQKSLDTIVKNIGN